MKCLHEYFQFEMFANTCRRAVVHFMFLLMFYLESDPFDITVFTILVLHILNYHFPRVNKYYLV